MFHQAANGNEKNTFYDEGVITNDVFYKQIVIKLNLLMTTREEKLLSISYHH